MFIKGIVLHGKGEGRKLGFPTANIPLFEKLESGVYAGTAKFLEKIYKAGIFVHDEKKILEAHFLDFDGDLYGKEIEVHIKEKIRENVPYVDDREIKQLIKKDIQKVRLLK